jgi:site-specific DNA recombinase
MPGSLTRDNRAQDALHDHTQTIAALRRAITDADTRGRRLARNLELIDNPDQDFIRDLNERRAQIRHEKTRLETQLTEAEDRAAQVPNPALLAELPIGAIDLARLPDDITRNLFEALRLHIDYDKITNKATCRITLTAETLHAAATTSDAIVIPFPNQQRTDNPDTETVGTQTESPPFRSSSCPRQESNLRHPL